AKRRALFAEQTRLIRSGGFAPGYPGFSERNYRLAGSLLPAGGPDPRRLQGARPRVVPRAATPAAGQEQVSLAGDARTHFAMTTAHSRPPVVGAARALPHSRPCAGERFR